MQIFPAIDLCGGQVVRLYQGDYEQMTVYGSNPCAAGKKIYRGRREISSCSRFRRSERRHAH